MIDKEKEKEKKKKSKAPKKEVPSLIQKVKRLTAEGNKRLKNKIT